jgi:hypothetical protein
MSRKLDYRELGNGTWELRHPIFGWIDERKLPYETRPWRPLMPSQPRKPDGTPTELAAGETFWANGHYLVFRRVVPSADGRAEMIHLSMRTVENDARHDWREMQRVKNELCGQEWEGVEIYPAESRVVDTANQYHLWCFPYPIPIGFDRGHIQDAEESARIGAKQRPLKKP